MIPKSWKRYPIPASCPVAPFIADLALRGRQVEKLSQTSIEGGANALKMVSKNNYTNLFSYIVLSGVAGPLISPLSPQKIV